MTTSKWVCAGLALVLALSGSLAPLSASAQQTMQSMQPAMTPGTGVGEPSGGAKTGAAFLNVIYVPGKVLLCGAGTVTSTALMLLTFGSGYRAAIDIFNEGCGGRWALTEYDVAGRRSPQDDAY